MNTASRPRAHQLPAAAAECAKAQSRSLNQFQATVEDYYSDDDGREAESDSQKGESAGSNKEPALKGRSEWIIGRSEHTFSDTVSVIQSDSGFSNFTTASRASANSASSRASKDSGYQSDPDDISSRSISQPMLVPARLVSNRRRPIVETGPVRSHGRKRSGNAPYAKRGDDRYYDDDVYDSDDSSTGIVNGPARRNETTYSTRRQEPLQESRSISRRPVPYQGFESAVYCTDPGCTCCNPLMKQSQRSRHTINPSRTARPRLASRSGEHPEPSSITYQTFENQLQMPSTHLHSPYPPPEQSVIASIRSHLPVSVSGPAARTYHSAERTRYAGPQAWEPTLDPLSLSMPLHYQQNPIQHRRRSTSRSGRPSVIVQQEPRSLMERNATTLDQGCSGYSDSSDLEDADHDQFQKEQNPRACDDSDDIPKDMNSDRVGRNHKCILPPTPRPNSFGMRGPVLPAYRYISSAGRAENISKTSSITSVERTSKAKIRHTKAFRKVGSSPEDDPILDRQHRKDVKRGSSAESCDPGDQPLKSEIRDKQKMDVMELLASLGSTGMLDNILNPDKEVQTELPASRKVSLVRTTEWDKANLVLLPKAQSLGRSFRDCGSESSSDHCSLIAKETNDVNVIEDATSDNTSNECEIDTESALTTSMNVIKNVLLRELLDHALPTTDSLDGSNSSLSRSGGGSDSSSLSPSSTDCQKSQRRKRMRGTGRSSGDGDGGGDGDGDSSDDDDRPKKKNEKNLPDRLPLRRLKCPFFQRQPEKYTKAACRGRGFVDMAKLKDHIKRVHTQPLRCSRCWKEMKSEDVYSEHLQKEIICEKKGEPQEDRIRPQLLKRLDFKKAPYVNARNAEEKWKLVFSTLFPNDTTAPPSYEQQGISLQLERALAEALEEELTRELALVIEPIMTRIKKCIPIIIENCRQKMMYTPLSSDDDVILTPSASSSFITGISSDCGNSMKQPESRDSTATSQCSGSSSPFSIDATSLSEKIGRKQGKDPQ